MIVTSGAIQTNGAFGIPFIAKRYDLESAQALVFSTLGVTPRNTA
ncbi:MAG: hypothetical protein QM690_03705 [Sphingobium sp.]